MMSYPWDYEETVRIDAEDILEFTSYDNAKAILAKYEIKL